VEEEEEEAVEAVQEAAEAVDVEGVITTQALLLHTRKVFVPLLETMYLTMVTRA
jgi:hypothetical protein